MGVREEMKLLGVWYSPFVVRAKRALCLKSVDYDYIEEDLFKSKSELLLKLNPVHKKVLVLIHNNKPVCESLNIVEYIDKTWNSSGPSILPSHPYDRALARFWSTFFDNKWFPTLRMAAITKSEEAKAKGMEEVGEGLLQLEDAFVSISKGKPFFGGKAIRFMDISLGSFLVILKAREKVKGEKLLDESKISSLCKWANHFLADDIVKNVFFFIKYIVKNVVPKIDEFAEFHAELEAKAQAAASTS